jgi:hypothetical protein
VGGPDQGIGLQGGVIFASPTKFLTLHARARCRSWCANASLEAACHQLLDLIKSVEVATLDDAAVAADLQREEHRFLS